MIDTVVLILTKDKFHISSREKFRPNAHWIQNKADWFKGICSKQNALKRELRSGIYKPYLTLSSRLTPSRQFEPMLKIELSLPKLMFGNNFDELQYKDFKSLIAKLQIVLEQMGVIVSTEALAHAPVSAIHYSKNIVLTDGTIPYSYIKKIKEANSSLLLDTNQTDYRNDGHCYKWHCNTYEVLFYDKIKDLEKAMQSSKRAIEKDSELQLNMFDTFKQRHKLEILRMEVRLNKRQKIQQLFKKLKIRSDLTFQKMFKPAISKKILLHYLDEIEKKRPLLLDFRKISTKSFLGELIFNNPKLGASQVFQVLGLKFALEIATLRELRNLLSHCNKRSWYRVMATFKKIKLPIPASPLKVIKEQLLKFKPLRIKQQLETQGK